MDFEMQPYIDPYFVYIKTDDQNRIDAVNSSAFLTDFDGWIEIDCGYGDRCHHAQGNYFDKPLYDERGIHRYKTERAGEPTEVLPIVSYIINEEKWIVMERTQEEMDADWVESESKPTIEQRVETLEHKVDVEMADQQEALRILGL